MIISDIREGLNSSQKNFPADVVSMQRSTHSILASESSISRYTVVNGNETAFLGN